MAAASGKENTPVGKKAQEQAKAAIAAAKAINPKYPPLAEAEKQFISSADKRAKEEAACTMTMDEATTSLNQGDKKRAKLLFESVINQGCAGGFVQDVAFDVGPAGQRRQLRGVTTRQDHFHRMRIERHQHGGDAAGPAGLHRVADQFCMSTMYAIEYPDGEHTSAPIRGDLVLPTPALHDRKPTARRRGRHREIPG